ncbi:MAG: hypothetical protein ABJB61_11175 [bacterium]
MISCMWNDGVRFPPAVWLGEGSVAPGAAGRRRPVSAPVRICRSQKADHEQGVLRRWQRYIGAVGVVRRAERHGEGVGDQIEERQTIGPLGVLK